MVFRDGIDVAQLQTGEVRHGISTHRHTVLVRSHPHAPQLVLVEVLGGDIGKRGLVALHIRKLAPLLVLEVEQQHAQVVGSHPEIALLVVAHLPDDDVIRHVLEALGAHQFRQRRVPALILRHMDIGTRGVCDDPRDAILVVIDPILIIGVVQTTPDVVILPQHLASLVVNAQQLTQVRHDQHALLRTRVVHDTEILRELPVLIAEWDVEQLLRGRIIDVIAVIPRLHEEALRLRVDIEILGTALDAKLCQCPGRPSFHRFRDGVVDGIVETVIQPQTAVVGLHD